MANYINSIELTTEKLNGLEYPCLQITNIKGEPAYLVPFRFYKFQVCGNKTGEWDLGSSDIRFFKKIFDEHMFDYNVCAEVTNELYKEVTACLTSYLKSSYGYPGKNIAVTNLDTPCFTEFQIESGYPDSIDGKFAIENLEYIDDFIDETYRMIKKYYNITGISAGQII